MELKGKMFRDNEKGLIYFLEDNKVGWTITVWRERVKGYDKWKWDMRDGVLDYENTYIIGPSCLAHW